MSRLDDGQQALLRLLERLAAEAYAFTTITPGSHGRILERDGRDGHDLRDLLGWSRTVPRTALAPEIVEWLEQAGALEIDGGRVRSRLRVSTVGGRLFLHSAYPTRAHDAVFLGPDTYRFARFVSERIEAGLRPRRIVDIGAGAGVGGVLAALAAPDAELVLTDLNPAATRLAQVNAAHAGVDALFLETEGLKALSGGLDLVLANPPFMANVRQTYSSGGDLHGAALSLQWAEEALERLTPGGRMLMYTASAIQKGGEDRLKRELEQLAAAHGARLDYLEIDPDIFGEVLSQQAYADVERLAAVGVTLVCQAA